MDGRLQVAAVEPREAFQSLMAFASNGGDYNIAWSGAFGRPAAWRSLGALCGCPVEVEDHPPLGPFPVDLRDSDLRLIERRAAECVWFMFESGTDWFYQVVSNFGLICIQPPPDDGRRTITLLAGTDTD